MTRWRPVWIVAANTALLYCVVQVAAYVALAVFDATVPPIMDAGLSDAEKANYAHMSDGDRDDLLRTTRQLRFRYEPVLGFMLEETTSRFVNIDRHGIRSNGPSRGVEALDGSIWFLGGSTAFGTGVADHETIPAQLERIVGQPVINLGVSNFASAEENLLLARHLRMGFRPSLALFFDGINETCWPDLYTEEMRTLVLRAQREYAWDPGGPARYAVDRAVRKTRRLLGFESYGREPLAFSCERDGRVTSLAAMHARRLGERDALCRLYAIDCRTIVQPFAGVHARTDGFRQSFLEGDAVDLRELFAQLGPNWHAAGAIFVNDALDHYQRHAFVDEVHYSADASRVIAEAIVARLALR